MSERLKGYLARMARTIEQGFRQLRSSLEITDLQASTVAVRQRKVREVLEEQLDVSDSFLTGSYMRSTMIAPLKRADVDIFMVVDSGYFDTNGQASLLDRVKRALKRHYKTPDISRNGRAVTITFDDFIVDVVPGFHRQGGGFLIPDSVRKEWVATDPQLHVEIFAETNKVHGGDFVPLVKMLKAWNRTHGGLLRSFHLETLARHLLTNVTISDFPSGCRWFFDKARDQLEVQLEDPAGYAGPVGYISAADLAGAKSRMETAFKRAAAAEQLALQERIADAFEQWRLIFPEHFPAYC
jgi:hypothetical protein